MSKNKQDTTMKVAVEVEEVNFNVLNRALEAFSNVLNQHLVASGNKIKLEEQDEGYDSHHAKQKYNWVVRVSIQWDKKPIKTE